MLREISLQELTHLWPQSLSIFDRDQRRVEYALPQPRSNHVPDLALVSARCAGYKPSGVKMQATIDSANTVRMRVMKGQYILHTREPSP